MGGEPGEDCQGGVGVVGGDEEVVWCCPAMTLHAIPASARRVATGLRVVRGGPRWSWGYGREVRVRR